MRRLLMMTFFLYGNLSIYGDCCKRPDQGLPGPTGNQGITGEQGSMGEIGPSATAVFISLSLESSQVVSPQAPVLFDLVNAIQGEISYDSLTGEITLTNAGTYHISFGITGSPSDRQVAIVANGGIIVNGSQIDTQSSQMQGSGLYYITSTPMTTVALINNQPNNSGQNITFSTSSPSSQTVYLIITRVY